MKNGALSAERLIELLGLQPHPEGGCYVETYRAPSDGGRGAVTAIYFLLRAGERSHWHMWMPWRSGSGMAGRRWSCRSMRTAVLSSAAGSE